MNEKCSKELSVYCVARTVKKYVYTENVKNVVFSYNISYIYWNMWHGYVILHSSWVDYANWINLYLKCGKDCAKAVHCICSSYMAEREIQKHRKCVMHNFIVCTILCLQH